QPPYHGALEALLFLFFLLLVSFSLKTPPKNDPYINKKTSYHEQITNNIRHRRTVIYSNKLARNLRVALLLKQSRIDLTAFIIRCLFISFSFFYWLIKDYIINVLMNPDVLLPQQSICPCVSSFIKKCLNPFNSIRMFAIFSNHLCRTLEGCEILHIDLFIKLFLPNFYNI